MVHEIEVPTINSNEDEAKLLEWFRRKGDFVKKEEVICTLETSKATFELESEYEGYFLPLVEAGSKVKFQESIAFIGDSISEIEESVPTIKEDDLKEITSEKKWTKKAELVARKYRIDISVIDKQGLIMEKDVQDYLLEQKPPVANENETEMHTILRGIVTSNITFPLHFYDEKKGVIDSTFLEYLSSNMESFGNLSSHEKCELYRKHGGAIGKNVTLGKGTVIISPQIIIDNDAEISDNSIIQCEEKFAIGKLSRFGSNLDAKCRIAIVGSNIYAGQNIRIGGGGHKDPWAVLVVGDLTYIGDDVFVNTCRPVLIGREVFLTQRSILVTHNIGHSVLEGYENRFAPVLLEDRSQIGMNCTIYAGIRIGRDAIVGSNSYVISDIPAGKFAIGVPAKVFGDSSHSVSRFRQVKLSRKIISDYHELLTLKKYMVCDIFDNNGYGFMLEYNEKRFMIVFIEKYETDIDKPSDVDEMVILTLDYLKRTLPEGCAIVDLLDKAIYGHGGLFLNSTREFLRKRGIRFSHEPWRYFTGLI